MHSSPSSRASLPHLASCHVSQILLFSSVPIPMLCGAEGSIFILVVDVDDILMTRIDEANI